MRNHTRLIVAGIALAGFVLVAVLSAPPIGAKDEDQGRALIEQAVKAVGGEKNAAAWKTLVETGELTVHWPGWGTPRAKCTLKVKRPDKLILDQDFSAYDHPFFFTYYYNAGDVWAIVNLGVRQSPRYTQAITRALNNAGGMYYYLSECDTFFVIPDVPDDSLVTSAEIDRVGIVDNGDTVMVDLDKKTHLPVRLLRDGGAEQALFADYKKTGSIKMPFKMTVYQGGAVSAEYVWEEIKFDEPIDDKLFEEHRPAKESSDG
jgi:hypothetical protein